MNSGGRFNGGEGLMNEGAGGDGGWARAGTLTLGDPTGIVSLQQDFRMAEIYTVQFGLDRSKFLIQSPSIVCNAAIIWSAGGNDVTRVVSVIDGMSISGTASAIRVVVQDFSTYNTFIPSANKPYDVSILVTKGARTAQSVPPTLWNPTLLSIAGPSDSGVIAIPQNCGVKSFQVQLSSLDGSVLLDESVQAIQRSQVGAATSSCDPRSVEWIPIDPFAWYVSIYNWSTATVKARIIWGIDG